MCTGVHWHERVRIGWRHHPKMEMLWYGESCTAGMRGDFLNIFLGAGAEVGAEVGAEAFGEESWVL